MTLTIEVPPNVEAKLAADAARRGVALPDYVAQVLASLVEGLTAAPTRHARPGALEAARRLRAGRDAMPALDIPLRELIEDGREH
jgi:hypothetical protein